VIASNLEAVALWSYGLAAAGFLVFVVRLVLGWRGGQRATFLFVAILASALWAGSNLMLLHWPVRAAWLAADAFDSIRYALWFVFLQSLVSARRSSVFVGLQRLPAPWWSVAAVAAVLIASVALSEGLPFTALLGSKANMVAFALRLGLAVVGLTLVEHLLRAAAPHARWAIKPLCLGLAGMFGFDLFFHADALLYGRLDADIWAARGIAHALILPFVAVATARNTAWTIDMHLSRGVIFHSTALFVSGVFLLALAAGGYFIRYVGGEWGKALQVELLFAAILLVALVVFSGGFRSKLKVFVSKHFFSYRYDYREEWLRFTRTLSSESSLPNVQERSIKALADLVESPAGALWLKQDGILFRQVSHWNLAQLDAVEPVDGAFGRFLERKGWVIDLREYESASERYPELILPEWLASVPTAWLIVPLISGTELIGFVVLVTARASVDVNWEVLDLLKTAGRQAASYLGQIEATEALLEARKFDAFNRMSAFVVHDLKNLVAQLSLMLKNAERHRQNPDFQRDMLMTVEHVVERMNQLMLQLRTGTTPVEKPRPIDLASVMRRVCQSKLGQHAPIELNLSPGIYTVGHEAQLEHVIGHLVQNGLDASPANGPVSVCLHRDDGSAVIEVVDSGVGMTPDFVRDRLFKPFQTTKSTGMGIGVYESSQYVTSLGGRILIESTPNVGTRVRVLLPLGDSAVASALAPKEAA